LLVVAYVVAVAIVELARSAYGHPRAADLGSSPAGVAAGRVWELLTSGFVVAGEPLAQLAGLALVAAVVVQRLGAGAFWRAALAGHFGSALLAYAGVGVLWLVSSDAVTDVIHAPDYGVSCVFAGAVGALAGAALMRRRRLDVALAVSGAVVFCVQIPFAPGLAGVEHLLAFTLGGVVAWSTAPSRASKLTAGRRAHEECQGWK
jgi:hypothetical protein